MTLFAKIILGWVVVALLIAMFIGSFIRKGRGSEAQNEDN